VFTKQRLDDLFTYHAPDGQQTKDLVKVREKAREMAQVIVDSTIPGRDQDAAIFNLRAAVMFTNTSIVLKGE